MVANYVLTHRKKAGLSQRELNRLLGYGGEASSVSRHEKSKTIPPLTTAMSYEVIFCVPIAKLFPELRLTVEQAVESRIHEMERELQEKSAKSSLDADRHAQKLSWLDERRAASEIG